MKSKIHGYRQIPMELFDENEASKAPETPLLEGDEEIEK